MTWCLRVLVCLVLLVVAVPAGRGFAETRHGEPLPTELAWIGLFNGALLGRLENENRLDALCPGEPWTVGWQDCRAEKLGPGVAVIPLRAEPCADAQRLGEIVLVALPGRGLQAFASAGRQARPFTPDLFDGDWGYGPYFHQTILGRQGNWLRVPVPSSGAAWVNAEDWLDAASPAWEETVLRTVRAGDIMRTPLGDMFVLGVEEQVLRVRPEQPSDMWCREGEPPAPEAWQEIRIPFSRLFDPEGHLLISYKYTRGC